MNAPSTILVGRADNCVWVRVEGKGSFQNSGGMRDFAREMIRRGYRDFVIDLRGCPVMDSTFMGTLAGIALRLRDSGSGSIRIANANARNSELLRNLGLNHLFEIGHAGAPPAPAEGEALRPAPGASGAEGKEEQARTMIEAHEALVEAAPANIERFRDVLEFLKHDIKDAR